MSKESRFVPSDAAKALAAKIDGYIDANRHAIVADMQKILTFKTVSGGSADEEIAAWKKGIQDGFAWIGERAAELGFEFRNLENTACVVEQSGESGSVGMLLHLDVVPPGEGWKHNPFSGALDDNVIYGRGCQDNKGPIVQGLQALAALKSLGVPFRKTVRLIVGSEEETGVWRDMKRYLESEPAPDLSIVPDASFPVVNGEKGMCDIRFAFKPKADETGAARIVSAKAGERGNIVPHLCEAVIEADPASAASIESSLNAFLADHDEAKSDLENKDGTLKIAFHGKNAHGSAPEKGHNAARDMARFLAGLDMLAGPRAEFLRFLAPLTEDDLGTGMGIAMNHSFIGATTQNLGILRVDEKECRAIFNIRSTLGQTVDEVLAIARERAAEESGAKLGVSAEFDSATYNAIHMDPTEHPEFISALRNAYATVTGREPRLTPTGGTTFAKAFPNACCFGPVDLADEEELAHKVDERIHVDHLLRNVRIFALAIGLLALGE